MPNVMVALLNNAAKFGWRSLLDCRAVHTAADWEKFQITLETVKRTFRITNSDR